MKRLTITALAIATGLLLAGCAAAAEPSTSSSERAAAPTAASTPTPTITAAPVEVTTAPTPEAKSDADQFLIKLQLAAAHDGANLNADETRAAADYVCDQLAAGVSEEAIVALTGDVSTQANADFVTVTAQGYCPVR